jgi:hypothetical protein
MSYNGLEHSYNKFSGKKVKEELSAFLPNLPGNIDTPGIQDNRWVMVLISICWQRTNKASSVYSRVFSLVGIALYLCLPSIQSSQISPICFVFYISFMIQSSQNISFIVFSPVEVSSS